MFKLTKQVDYALHLIRTLSDRPKEQPLSLRQFSKESSISFLFLQRIAKRLKEAGLVEAISGAKGGYVLLRDAKMIRLKEVVEAIEGPYGIVDCVTPGKECSKTDTCGVKDTMHGLNKQIVKMLDSTTVI